MATRSVPQLSLEAAQIASNAAQEKAKQLGIDFNIALVDSTLHLLHFTRMPTAKLTSISIAINKAFTAAGHRIPTSAYTTGAAAKNFAPGGVAYGIHNSNDGRFTLIGGGVPIEIEGQVVGAIGVSTGTPGQDEEVARAGVEAVGRWVKRKEGSKL
ncbi:ethanolamine utilization protein eutT [Sphaerulina musiva SO2202]|uniref:Ethanolamine utilization protein eutT n=1 Tax=Sphaerulina musiva (strain SO2202) TaxID=692275 RepID=M3BV11_SPHMS|nr:ethanolamine utilization protein eutT [Sphaerulina musiva SO2202]EMF11159.1 ethanolamine utilization protein eutT [Sphaerulina musiva SO2202]